MTPLVLLSRFCPQGTLFAKLEMHNPTGSVKYRAAKAMLDHQRRIGNLTPGSTILEATSGNMGIALAALCAREGLRCILVMPHNQSPQRSLLMKVYGAQVICIGDTMPEAVRHCQHLATHIPGAVYLRQFENPANVQAHFESTGPELLQQCPHIDLFVAGVGTGGTLTGVGRYLKSHRPDVEIWAVEPAQPGQIPGIGAGFVSPILDLSLPDGICAVSLQDALHTQQALAKTEGIFVGPSAGAALFVANQLAAKPENAGKAVVALAPDSGERYLTI